MRDWSVGLVVEKTDDVDRCASAKMKIQIDWIGMSTTFFVTHAGGEETHPPTARNICASRLAVAGKPPTVVSHVFFMEESRTGSFVTGSFTVRRTLHTVHTWSTHLSYSVYLYIPVDALDE